MLSGGVMPESDEYAVARKAGKVTLDVGFCPQNVFSTWPGAGYAWFDGSACCV